MLQLTIALCVGDFGVAVAIRLRSLDTEYLHSIYFPDGTDFVNAVDVEFAFNKKSSSTVV